MTSSSERIQRHAAAKAASNLNTTQFALFPPDHPAMRERGPAEFTPQEYNEKPGALFHGTYAAKMPREGMRDNSAGIHLGTLDSAKERMDNLGPRRTSPNTPADIHVRRLNPGVGTKHAQMPMKGTPENPTHDRGADWTTHEDPHMWQTDRGADKFGEYYRNDTEDMGSVSVRVPDHGYLSSHEDAVKRAEASGKPVNALTKGLLEHHGGRGVDEPIKHQATQEGRFKRAGMEDPWADEKVNHESLLPYKIRGNPSYKGEEGFPREQQGHSLDRGGRRTASAITFTATREEAEDKTELSTGMSTKKGTRWKKNYIE